MDKLFWVIPEILAGRPGPDRESWDLESFSEIGIRAILSVNSGFLCNKEDFKNHGINYACIPLADNAPPLPGDEQICLNALPKAYEFVTTQLKLGHKVLVHCSAGRDRTGLFLSYFLMLYMGISAKKAINTIRQIRPTILNAAGWEKFTGQILRDFEKCRNNKV